MKKLSLKNTMIAGTIFSLAVVPVFANQTVESFEGERVMSVEKNNSHWGQSFIKTLGEKYNVEKIFQEKNLDDKISSEEMKILVQTVIDDKYDQEFPMMTREAVVSQLMEIWELKTNKNLDEIPLIKMIIYADTDKIHSQYRHNILVAYSYNISRGREDRFFAPKDQITYGEAAALVSNLKTSIDKETKEQGNDKEQKEEKFETSIEYELTKGQIDFSFSLSNHYNDDKKIGFSSGQQFELVITDEKGEEVHRYSDDKFFTEAFIYKNLEKGKSLHWKYQWDLTDKKGEKLKEGKYKAEVEILPIVSQESTIEKEELKAQIKFIVEK